MPMPTPIFSPDPINARENEQQDISISRKSRLPNDNRPKVASLLVQLLRTGKAVSYPSNQSQSNSNSSLFVIQSVSSSPDAEAKALLDPLRPIFCCLTLKPDPDYICVPGPISSTLQRGRLCNFFGYMSTFSLTYSVPVASDITWSDDAIYLIQVQVFHKKEPSKVVMKRKNNGWTKAQRGKKLEEYKKFESEKWVQRGLGRFFVESVYERRKRLPECAFEEVITTEERVPAFFQKVDAISLVVECAEHGVKYVCDFWARE